MKKQVLFILALLYLSFAMAQTQREVEYFKLQDIRLLESPFKHAQELDKEYLLALDADRLLAPFLREAGLIPKAESDDYKAQESIYSMHNFIDTSDWIIRKGAIRLYQDEKMIIPFNMRDGILICEGKSNEDWNCSALHGAGRILARNQAFKTLDMDEFEKEMEGIYSSSICKATLDESPMAYKDKDMIIESITDTATILDSVKPILNIKSVN